jgi:fused signal recognition particle receptor
MALFDRFKKNQTIPEDATTDAPKPAGGDTKPGPSAGIFSRIRKGLKKTSDLLNTDIRDLFKREGRLVDDEFLDELFAVLVKTDMGGGPANEIREDVQQRFRGRVVEMP